MAKFVVSWKARLAGTAQQNHDDVKKTLETFSRWQPPADQDWQPFVLRVDNQGGFAFVETDNPAGLLEASSKFFTFNEVEIFPVVDIADGVARLYEGVEFRESI
jgi:hypothetical protein